MAHPEASSSPNAIYILASLLRWLMWRYVTRGGKPTKAPFVATRARSTWMKASSTDPTTWRTYDEALDCYEARPGAFKGVGLVLGDLGDGWHLCGVDLDSCIVDGAIADWAKLMLDLLCATYVEISPSGIGLKAFFFASAGDASSARDLFGIDNDKWGCKRSVGADGADHGPAVECYLGDGRFFCFTGQRWPDALDDVASFGIDTLERLAALMPAKLNTSNGNGKETSGSAKSNDTSRSARALRLAGRARRQGKSYENFVDAVRTDPETAAWAAEKGEPYDQRELKRAWERAGSLPESLPTTEDALALLYADLHADRLRYCYDNGCWFEWDGELWRPEKTELAFHWARQVCRDVAQGMEKPLTMLSKVATAKAVEHFARADRVFAVRASQWNRDPWLLGTPAGTVDLRTGRLRDAMQSDFITKATSVPPAPTADCPRWLEFLGEVTQGDHDLIRFMQQFLGYCLTGSTREHAVMFIYGPGNNGKSVLQETMVSILNDYAQTAAMETFVASRHDRHPAELAALRGARLVAAAETAQGRAWNETRIKQLTGGDTIAARFMRQDFFTFRPEFKPVFIGNHKPRLRDVGESTRRRFNIVPFLFKPENPDRHLTEKLRPEHPAILRWQIDGCLDWQEHGLVRPDVVTRATDDYFNEQDLVARWVEERCDTTKAFFHDTTTNLFTAYCWYAEAANERPCTQIEFQSEMERLGYPRRRITQRQDAHYDKWCFIGLELKD